MSPIVVLTVGGSDSAGFHGVQADLRTFAALGAHGCTALTVVTAQDSLGVHRASPVPVEVVATQIDVVLADLSPAAAKTGMLGRVELVELVGDRLGDRDTRPLVIDPVLVDKAGRVLFGADVLGAYRRLLPRASVVTPNRLEAQLLAGEELVSPGAVATFAASTGTAVVLTGGRDASGRAVDLLWDGDALHHLDGERFDTTNVAGSGDAFSSALTVHLAAGLPLLEAAQRAKAFVSAAVAHARSWRLGRGPGPIDHLGWSARG